MGIKVKKKPCKGINKARGYEGCGEEVYDRKHGLCKSCYPKWLYSTEAGVKEIERHTIPVKKVRENLESAKAERKIKSQLEFLKVNTRTACHLFIKQRDKGKPCVSCGTPWRSDFQSGHWFKASDYSNLKYDERNIHGQCRGCNLMKDGNEANYGLRIAERIGEEGKQDLERLAREYKQQNFKWDREELKEIRKYFQKKYKELIAE